MNNLLKNYLCLPSLNTLTKANSIQKFDYNKAFDYGGTIGNDCTASTPCVRVLSTPTVGGDFVQSNFKF